jgi:DNA repair protein SbcC/Rad50
MKRIPLTLNGFCGFAITWNAILTFVRPARGSQLVAILGDSGRGKTTIMDNLTPFRRRHRNSRRWTR